MKALIVIEIDENHLHKESMELYEKLKGYKCELKPIPEKKPNERFWLDDEFNGGYRFGWNDCIDAIAGETE